jgi:hypothetical protein
VSRTDRSSTVHSTYEVRPHSFGESANLTSEKASLYKEATHQIALDMGTKLADWLPGFTVEETRLIEAEPGQPLTEEPDGYDSSSALIDTEPACSILTELSLGLTLVTGLLGGSTMPAGKPRELTSVEERVLDLVTTTFLEAAATTLLIEGAVAATHDKEGGVFGGRDEETDARLGLEFVVQGPGGGGLIILGFQLWALQKFSDTVDARLAGRRTAVVVPDSINDDAAVALNSVPVPFVVNLGQINLTAGEVVELQEGDVIKTRVAVDSPAIASVGTVNLFIVRLGRAGQQLVAEIVDTIDVDNPLEGSMGRAITQ